MILFKYEEKKGKEFLKRVKGKSAIFLSTVAHTETSSIPNISAAGASTELIKYTPAADIEAIYYGKAKCLETVPENPLGPPSPVIISIAALKLLQIPFLAIDAGLKIVPKAPIVNLGGRYGESMETGRALFESNIEETVENGNIFASEIAKSYDFVILGESVPGGTTTAMALLAALGYAPYDKISGSMPGNNLSLKEKVVKKALTFVNKDDSPLEKVKKVGDPMQPVQAMMAITLAKAGVPVLLAGGTQMISVLALIKELAKDEKVYDNLAICTTKWVTEDADANPTALMEEIGIKVPFFSANLDFSQSKIENLKFYEQGYVKEGVGAGALSAVVFNELEIKNVEFLEKIEEVYGYIYKN